mgnify:CR=1 FL=1
MAKNNYYNADGDGFVADLKAAEVYSQAPMGSTRQQSFVSNSDIVGALQTDIVVVEVIVVW